jgi:hypothetical protein
MPADDRSRAYIAPPIDWSDMAAWDRYLTSAVREAPFVVPTAIGAPGWECVRFLKSVKRLGGRVWFPGCGVDPGPRFYSFVGCNVLVTDFASVAVGVQQGFAALAPEAMFTDWSGFVKGNPLSEPCGTFDVNQHDFTTGTVPGVFDVVVNRRAFQGLSLSAKRSAARHFFTALRPGGAAMIDTVNVQGPARDVLEDSLRDAGFFIPFSASERWYRDQLQSTGIVYGMVLDHPRIPNAGQYPAERFNEYAERDEQILASFRPEYEARLAAEEPSVREVMARPETIVAHVIYTTG